MTDTTPIKIRASSLTGYVDCQLRTLLQTMPHVAREHGHDLDVFRANIGALVGTGVHAAAERGLKAKMLGKLCELDELQDAGIESFRQRIDEEMEDGAIGILFDEETPNQSTAQFQISRMAARYADDIIAKITPVSVEARIECEAGDGIILSGQSDVLALVIDGDKRRLKDLKTGRRKTEAIKHMPQQGAYSLLERSVGHTVDEGEIDHLRRSPKGVVQAAVETEPYDIIAAEQIASAVLTDFGAKAKHFARTGDPSVALCNPSSRLCSAKFCRAYGRPVCAATRNL